MSTENQEPTATPIGDLLSRVDVVRGDITEETVEVIVSAGSRHLFSGSGVQGAIHAAAGPELRAECIARHPDGCPHGEVRVTGGYDLLAQWVIHAVGPIFLIGDSGEPEALANCYRSALEEAHALGARSIAFPAISCGAFCYPPADAAVVALDTIVEFLDAHRGFTMVRIVILDEETFAAFRGEFDRRRPL